MDTVDKTNEKAFEAPMDGEIEAMGPGRSDDRPLTDAQILAETAEYRKEASYE